MVAQVKLLSEQLCFEICLTVWQIWVSMLELGALIAIEEKDVSSLGFKFCLQL